MPTLATELAPIALNAKGVPIIVGTGTKVIEVVLTSRAQGWTPEEVQANLPHLSLTQIHAALAYYQAHQPELDADMERRRSLTSEMEAQARSKGQISRAVLTKRLHRKTGTAIHSAVTGTNGTVATAR